MSLISQLERMAGVVWQILSLVQKPQDFSSSSNIKVVRQALVRKLQLILLFSIGKDCTLVLSKYSILGNISL